MLEPIKHLEKAMEIPLYHHERWNGSGYPQGLKKDIIPLSARIFAVVDVWDALTSDRPYRNAWSVEKTLQYIEDNAGVLFDPKVVKAFLKLLKESS
jgi:HD-GYP domain-containing protein (c-di-GMP phosphodiesterase class II)